MQTIKLNLILGGVLPVCFASQNDTGRVIRFLLFEGENVFTLSGAETIALRLQKPDGSELVESVTNTGADYVDVVTTADTCDTAGASVGEIVITDGGDVIGSANFGLFVESDAFDKSSDITTQTASGAIATFETNIETAFVSLKSDINPVQDLHGYTKPWSGGGGKNKANKANDLPSGSGITITVANDGTLTINGTSTETCFIRGYFNCPDSTATYTWALFNNKAFESGVEFSVRTSDNSSAGGWARVNATNKTFSFTPSAAPTKWQFQISSGVTFNNAVFKPMIVSGNTAPTDFEPYSNICPISGFSALNVTLADGDMQTVDTASVNFGQTVYGGVADVTNGKVKVTHVIVDLGTLDWINEDSALSGLARVNTVQVAPLGAKYLQIPICTQYEGVYSKGFNAFNNGEIAFCNSEALPMIRARSTEFAGKTNAQIKALMSGVMLCYELATPIEITTTPENLTAIVGQNNVYSDTGDTEVEYYIEV